MKERIAQICLDYVNFRVRGKSKEARQLLEDMPKEEFKFLYASGLEYLKNIVYDNTSPYILVSMTRQLFIEHDDDINSVEPNDINCLIIDWFIYHLAHTFEKSLSERPRNSFAEQLAKDPDPEVAAVGREILASGRG